MLFKQVIFVGYLEISRLGLNFWLWSWVWNNKIFRVTRSIGHKKQNVSLSNYHLSIDFGQHRIHNFICHPWFLTWIVMHVIRTFRFDQVPETFLGLALLQITIGSITFSNATLTKKAIACLVLDFLPPLAWLFFSASFFSGSALKKQSVSSMFQILAGS